MEITSTTTSMLERNVRISTLGERWRRERFIHIKEDYESGYNTRKVRCAFAQALMKEGWGEANGDLALRMVALMPYDPQNHLYQKLWSAVLNSGILGRDEGYALLEEISEAGSAQGVFFNILVTQPQEYETALYQLLDNSSFNLEKPKDPKVCLQLRKDILSYLDTLPAKKMKAVIQTLIAKGIDIKFLKDEWGFLPHRIESTSDQALGVADCFMEELSFQDYVDVLLDGGWAQLASEKMAKTKDPRKIFNNWFKGAQENSKHVAKLLPQRLIYFSTGLKKIEETIAGRDIVDLSEAYNGERAQVRQSYEELCNGFKEVCLLRSVLERRVASLNHFIRFYPNVSVLRNSTERMIKEIDKAQAKMEQFVDNHDQRFNPPGFIYDQANLDEWKVGQSFKLTPKPARRKRLRRVSSESLSLEGASLPHQNKRVRQGNTVVGITAAGIEKFPLEEPGFWDEAFSSFEPPKKSSNTK